MNKYRNIKIEYDGIEFDSKKEMKRYIELKYLEKAGEIENIKVHEPIEVLPKTNKFRAINYICDFVYETKDGQVIYEDVKGRREGTQYQLFKNKIKTLYYLQGIEIHEI